MKYFYQYPTDTRNATFAAAIVPVTVPHERADQRHMPPTRFPRRAVQDFRRSIGKLIKQAKRRHKALLKAYEAERKAAGREDTRVDGSPEDRFRGLVGGFRIEYQDRVQEMADGTIVRHVEAANATSKAGVIAQWMVLKGITPFEPEAAVNEAVREATESSVRKLSGIGERYHDEITAVLVDAWKKGKRTEDVAKQLEARFGVLRSRGQFIARNEFGNLNAELTKVRQEANGVAEYIWRNSNDERVVGNPAGLWPKGSPSHGDHWAREGQRFRWDKPPHDGHPGQAPLCRCTAEPVLPEIERDREPPEPPEPPEQPPVVEAPTAPKRITPGQVAVGAAAVVGVIAIGAGAAYLLRRMNWRELLKFRKKTRDRATKVDLDLVDYTQQPVMNRVQRLGTFGARGRQLELEADLIDAQMMQTAIDAEVADRILAENRKQRIKPTNVMLPPPHLASERPRTLPGGFGAGPRGQMIEINPNSQSPTEIAQTIRGMGRESTLRRFEATVRAAQQRVDNRRITLDLAAENTLVGGLNRSMWEIADDVAAGKTLTRAEAERVVRTLTSEKPLRGERINNPDALINDLIAGRVCDPKGREDAPGSGSNPRCNRLIDMVRRADALRRKEAEAVAKSISKPKGRRAESVLERWNKIEEQGAHGDFGAVKSASEAENIIERMKKHGLLDDVADDDIETMQVFLHRGFNVSEAAENLGFVNLFNAQLRLEANLPRLVEMEKVAALSAKSAKPMIDDGVFPMAADELQRRWARREAIPIEHILERFREIEDRFNPRGWMGMMSDEERRRILEHKPPFMVKSGREVSLAEAGMPDHIIQNLMEQNEHQVDAMMAAFDELWIVDREKAQGLRSEADKLVQVNHKTNQLMNDWHEGRIKDPQVIFDKAKARGINLTNEGFKPYIKLAVEEGAEGWAIEDAIERIMNRSVIGESVDGVKQRSLMSLVDDVQNFRDLNDDELEYLVRRIRQEDPRLDPFDVRERLKGVPFNKSLNEAIDNALDDLVRAEDFTPITRFDKKDARFFKEELFPDGRFGGVVYLGERQMFAIIDRIEEVRGIRFARGIDNERALNRKEHMRLMDALEGRGNDDDRAFLHRWLDKIEDHEGWVEKTGGVVQSPLRHAWPPNDLQPSFGSQGRAFMSRAKVSHEATGVQDGHHINETRFLHIEVDGKPKRGVFKPSAGEDPRVFEWFGVEDQATREVSVSALDDLFEGPPVVPPTVYREIDPEVLGGQVQGRRMHEPVKGSMQLFENSMSLDDAAKAVMKRDPDFWTAEARAGRGATNSAIAETLTRSEAFHKMVVMDIVNGNADRHGGNVLWKPNFKTGAVDPIAIDNGLAFTDPIKLHETGGVMKKPVHMAGVWGWGRFQQALDDLKLIKLHEYARRAILNDVRPQRVREALIRLRALQKQPNLIENMWGGIFDDQWLRFHKASTGEDRHEFFKLDLDADDMAKIDSLIDDALFIKAELEVEARANIEFEKELAELRRQQDE